MKTDPRFLKEEGWEVFTGNELLVKGLLETEGGTHLWTGYPGSPVAGFFDCAKSIQALLKKNGIHATIANNEALSAAALNGSQMEGLRAIAVMKSVGVHVAADALALGNLSGAHPEGGVLVGLGDDPWNDSTQVPADSRFLCKHLHMPVLEPSTPQELKDWVEKGFQLSAGSELYIGYLLSTNLADGGGSVETRRNNFPRVSTLQRKELDTLSVDFEKRVLLPPRTSRREEAFAERYERLWQKARLLELNTLRNPDKHAPIGFVASGLAYSYLCHALDELGLLGEFPILKLGVTYPIDPTALDEMAKLTSTLVVVEERRGFIEEQIAQLVMQRELPFRVYGKRFPGNQPGIPETGGLNASVITRCLAPWLEDLISAKTVNGDIRKLHAVRGRIETAEKLNQPLPLRTPTFCPGCPHRDSASVLMEMKSHFRDARWMCKHHRREPVDLLFHGDTGCYTMLMFEPTKDLMHNYSGMGLGGGTGSGIDPFVTNKQVVFMGDSTFFHSGQAAISHSVKNGQDITYIILDNKTTAMTGHQPTPGVKSSILGDETPEQDIEDVARALLPNKKVTRTNPEEREPYRKLLEKTILQDGVKVIIADKECGITFNRKKKRAEAQIIAKKGYLPRKKHINITPEVCEFCLECANATGCPGLTVAETERGKKIQTDVSWCVGDLACAKLEVCPSFEELTIIRSQKPEREEFDFKDLPEPRMNLFDQTWHVYLAGVGGMGIATSTAVMVRAAHRQGFQVTFCDRAGLAIRNGGVYSQMMLHHGAEVSPLIPYGKADLVLGLDPLEAARGITGVSKTAHPDYTSAIVNLFKTPTTRTLLNQDEFSLDELAGTIRKGCKEFFGANLSDLSERVFGTKLYVNVILLGAAFQAGKLPLTLENLEWGMRETMGNRFNENWRAFNLGRKIYFDSAGQAEERKPRSYHDVVAERSEAFAKRGQKKLAKTYWKMVTQAVERIRVDEESLCELAWRIEDLIQYGGVDFAQDYIDRVAQIFRQDLESENYAATRAVIRNLHRVLAIKDEVEVARLLTRPEKYERDRRRYRVNPELGDRIEYRHINRPEFALGFIKIRFRIKTRPWMLRLMARAKVLRGVPGWHRKERRFRRWYKRLLNRFNPEHYESWVEILKTPEEVRGYREVRYPKMESARARVEQLLRETASETKPQAVSKLA